MRVPRTRRRGARLRRAAALALSLVVVGLLMQGSGGSTASAYATTCGGEVPPAKSDGTAWVCSFDDEFSSSTLDPVWTATLSSNTGLTSGTAPYRACFVNSPNNESVRKGYLRLTVRKERSPITCKTLTGSFSTYYTSGSLSTVGKFGQRYGRFSVRARLPDTALKGLQETFWLWPVNSVKYAAYGPAWAEPSGEIDFAELYSSVADRNVPFLHYYLDP
ncbi:MAG: hypothetical protein QOG80_2842, partial [Pseudonocardiales bacterium]|nr:hypothetical protein [Pseudonocardiales bacterium]